MLEFKIVGMTLTVCFSLLAFADLVRCYKALEPIGSISSPMIVGADNENIAETANTSIKFGLLFGTMIVMPVAEPPHPTPAPVVIQTPFPRLILSGVLSGANAVAVILDGGGQEQVYRPGDLLPSGARLEAVMENAVHVSFGGTTKVMRMEWTSGNHTGADVLPTAMPYDQASPPVADPAAVTVQ